MTTQATQSNNALGRRNLPSTLFAPLQSARRYIERQRSESGEDAVNSGGETRPRGENSLEGGVPVLAQTVAPASVSRLESRSTVAFADVARQVWSQEFEEAPVSSAQETSTAAFGGSQAISATSHAIKEETAQKAEPQSVGASEAQGLAHDANNLLSALRLYSELLCFSGVLHERHRHYAEDLKLLSVRSQGLIERLLRLADGMGGEPTAPRPFASSRMLQEECAPASGSAELVRQEEPVCLISLAETLARMRGLLGTIAHGALEISVCSSEVQVPVEAESLDRILVNLVSNAAVAVRGGGAIRIRARALEGGPMPLVVLTVDDSGCGMNASQLAAVCGDPAGLTGTAPETTEHASGCRHGLGLSIVRQLVAASGGEFFVDSRLGTGTRVELRWETRSATGLAAKTSGQPLSFASRRSVAATSATPVAGAAPEQVDRYVGAAMGNEGAIAC